MALVEHKQDHPELPEEKNAPPLAEVPQGERTDEHARAPARGRDKPTQEKPSRLATMGRHPWATAAIAIAIIAVLVAALIWWLNARQYESTDDAFIDARTVQISPQVGGVIVDVPVNDNQPVTAGSPLVHIDPRDYQVAVAQAQAQLEQAQAVVANIDAQIAAQISNIDQTKTNVTQTNAALVFSREEQARYAQLLANGAGTQQRSQQANSDLTQKQAAFAAAQAAQIAAEKQLGVLQAQKQSALAQVDATRAQLSQAKLNLSRTTINASVDGRVVRLTAAKGAYTQPGQALMAVVPRVVWITANFKETQLSDMHVGQHVDIEVDAYPGKTFQGHVDSIQAGSGVVFSLLPPENATGNYVKVVQRVPVKIVFDNPPDVYLGPGMSVVPTVKVR
jgi:membrane fusion protein (multidrug efflux system)